MDIGVREIFGGIRDEIYEIARQAYKQWPTFDDDESGNVAAIAATTVAAAVDNRPCLPEHTANVPFVRSFVHSFR